MLAAPCHTTSVSLFSLCYEPSGFLKNFSTLLFTSIREIASGALRSLQIDNFPPIVHDAAFRPKPPSEKNLLCCNAALRNSHSLQMQILSTRKLTDYGAIFNFFIAAAPVAASVHYVD